MKVGMSVICAVALAVACGEDEQLGPGSGGAAGSGATGGTASGGSSGSSGSSGASGSGGSVAGGGSGGSDAAAGGSAGDGGPGPGRLLVAGTDFFSKTEVATVDLATNTVVGSVTLDDGDAVPASSAGRGFVLERTSAKLDVLDATGKVDKTIDVGKAALGLGGSGSTNPVSLIASESGGTSRAHVLLQNVNRIAIVNLSSGSLVGNLDLAPYWFSKDFDGSADATSAVRPAGANRMYFVLGRIDRTTVKAPDFQLACPAVPALLLALDLATDTLVDLNGAAAGEGIELSMANPVDMAFDAGQNRLLVLHAGCFASADGGTSRTKHGVEAVDLTTFVATAAYTPANQDFLARFLLRNSTSAIIDSFDPTFAEHWYPWSVGQPTFGTELSSVPGAPTLEDENHLLGVDIATGDAGSTVDVVRYDLTAQTKVKLVGSPWTGSFSSAAGSALVN